MQASLLCGLSEGGPVEDTLNGVNGLGCLTTVIFEQSPGGGGEAGSAEVSRTFQAHRGDGQGKRRRQGAAHK